MNSPWRRDGMFLSLWLVLLVGLRAEMVIDDVGRFAIDMPAPQTRSQNETTSGLGKTVIHLLAHDIDSSTAVLLGYNDYPAGSVAKLDLAKTYRDVMAGVASSMKMDAKTSGNHQLSDVMGWEYTLIDKEGKMSGHVRTYFVGDRLYQVMYLGAPGTENGEMALHFLNSLRLLR